MEPTLNQTKDDKETCTELKTIKYKTMLLSGSNITETSASSDMINLHEFLENEKNKNKQEPWTKLDKTLKIQKLNMFADKYSETNELSKEDHVKLVIFLKDCVDKKKLVRVKDVLYDKDEGFIKEIPSLFFNKQRNQFTLKRSDKRVSTLKSLPLDKSSVKTKAKKVVKTTKKTSTSDSTEDLDD